LSMICNQLRAQTAQDGNQAWTNLIVNSPSSGQPLRALSPQQGLVMRPSDFTGYFDPYVNQVFTQYTNDTLNLTVNGEKYTGGTSSNALVLGTESFQRPRTADIFSSNSGPFTTGADGLRNAMIPQLAAAFNRSTLLVSNQVPAPITAFYQNAITNHYSRIV